MQQAERVAEACSEQEGGLVARDKKPYFIGSIFLPCVGFAILRFWAMCFEEGGVVYSTDHLAFLMGLLGRGLFPLIMVVALNARPLSDGFAKTTMWPAAFLSSLGGVIVQVDWASDLHFLMSLGTVMGLSGLGWLYVCWSEVYRHIRIRDVILSMLLSLLVSSVFSLVLAFLPSGIDSVSVVLIPFAATALFFYYRKKGYPALGERASFAGHYEGMTVAVVGKWFIMLALYSTVLGSIHVISSASPNAYESDSLYLVYTGTSVLIASALIGSVLARNRFLSLRAFWMVIISAICMFLVLAITLEDILQPVLSVFAAIRYIAFGFINIKLIDIAHHYRKPLYAVFAAGWGVIQLSMTLGMCFTLYAFESLGLSMNVVVAALLAALTMGSLFFLNGSSVGDIFIGAVPESAKPLDSSYAAMQDALMQSCRELQERYKLTGRETEIVLLVAQGHTQTFCADALVVSINTIRSHMKHIYAKMDIHSKDELLKKLAEDSSLQIDEEAESSG